jgi:hypothetical protein
MVNFNAIIFNSLSVIDNKILFLQKSIIMAFNQYFRAFLCLGLGLAGLVWLIMNRKDYKTPALLLRIGVLALVTAFMYVYSFV